MKALFRAGWLSCPWHNAGCVQDRRGNQGPGIRGHQGAGTVARPGHQNHSISRPGWLEGEQISAVSMCCSVSVDRRTQCHLKTQPKGAIRGIQHSQGAIHTVKGSAPHLRANATKKIRFSGLGDHDLRSHDTACHTGCVCGQQGLLGRALTILLEADGAASALSSCTSGYLVTWHACRVEVV